MSMTTDSPLFSKFLLGILVLGLWCNSFSSLPAAEQPKTGKATKSATPDARETDRTAIRQTAQRFAEAFQKHDAETAASLMTEGAAIIPADAEPVRGRDAIRQLYAAHFEKKERPTLKVEPLSIEFLSQDTAVEQGTIIITTTVNKLTETDANEYEILYVREKGDWLIANLREWPIVTSGLEDLEWIIGTWSAKQPEAEILTTYEWFGNKAFILARFTAREKDKSLTGMQLIGTDPATNSLRTWTFEKDGGFGEGACHRDGKGWVFETATILANGNIVTAENLLIPVDANTFTWQPINLTTDGEEIVDLPPVKVTRVQPTARVESSK